MGTYTEPVDRLRHLRVLEPGMDIESTDYLKEFGLGREHIPDLIRLATDPDFTKEGSDDLDYSATIYALEALIQLRAEEAVEPLLSLFQDPDNEWAMSCLAKYYGTIGPKTIPALITVLSDPTQDPYSRSFAADSIEKVGLEHPEARLACIQALVATLNSEQSPDDLNGFLLGHLMNLKAVEALPDVEKAFQEDRVDLSIVGDWDDFQVELGLKEPGDEKKRYSYGPDLDIISSLVEGASQAGKAQQTDNFYPATYKLKNIVKTGKNKAKMAKAARKKNRRKK